MGGILDEEPFLEIQAYQAKIKTTRAKIAEFLTKKNINLDDWLSFGVLIAQLEDQSFYLGYFTSEVDKEL